MASGSFPKPVSDSPVFHNNVELQASSSSHAFRYEHTVDEIGVTPSSSVWMSPLIVRDKNGAAIATIQVIHDTAGKYVFNFYITDQDGSSVKPFGFAVDAQKNITYAIGDKNAFKSALGIS